MKSSNDDLGLTGGTPITAWRRRRTWLAVGVGAPIPPGNDYGERVRRTEAAVAELKAVVERWARA